MRHVLPRFSACCLDGIVEHPQTLRVSYSIKTAPLRPNTCADLMFGGEHEDAPALGRLPRCGLAHSLGLVVHGPKTAGGVVVRVFAVGVKCRCQTGSVGGLRLTAV